VGGENIKRYKEIDSLIKDYLIRRDKHGKGVRGKGFYPCLILLQKFKNITGPVIGLVVRDYSYFNIHKEICQF
jgi:hypothetical protein